MNNNTRSNQAREIQGQLAVVFPRFQVPGFGPGFDPLLRSAFPALILWFGNAFGVTHHPACPEPVEGSFVEGSKGVSCVLLLFLLPKPTQHKILEGLYSLLLIGTVNLHDNGFAFCSCHGQEAHDALAADSAFAFC